MRGVAKTVYYCDYCRKHGLSPSAMEKHEAGCTLNPQRVCRWKIDGHSDGSSVIAITPIAVELAARALRRIRRPEDVTLLSQVDVDWLRDEVGGCPACMLAALRQARVDDYHYDARSTVIFDYGTEVERLRAEERDEAAVVW